MNDNTIDINALLQTMLNTFIITFTEQGAQVGADLKSHIETELRAIVNRIQQIGQMLTAKQISNEDAQILVDMQKETALEHLLTVTGAAKVVLQDSLNAAMNAVKDAIHLLLGIAL